MRVAVNLSILFTEFPFLERFEHARRAGFSAVEFWFPYGEDLGAIARELRRLRLELVLFNLEVGNFAAGERGYACHPDRRERFRETVELGIEVAQHLGCRRLNVLVGNALPDIPRADQRRVLVENLREAARAIERWGILLLFEALNPHDAPDYFLHTSAEAFAILEEVAEPNLKFQYDVYHMQRSEGNLTDTITRHVDRIGHIQIADSPDRGPPGTGEINFRYLLRRIAASGYTGYVSAEYRPQGPSAESFGWMREVLP
ncbi:MAG: TIM barrel protein [Armatimonadetes bacterium]|nr:TIM barrel protein [Armatimonadota bacterium]MDW8153208.1 TIM barrel protein [Armatimonadota bacterium]